MLNENRNLHFSRILISLMVTVSTLSTPIAVWGYEDNVLSSVDASTEDVTTSSQNANTNTQDSLPETGKEDLAAQPENTPPETPPSSETPPPSETPSEPQELPKFEIQPPSNETTPTTPTTPFNTPNSQPESGQTPPAEEARVLIAEVLIRGTNTELENLIFNSIRTRPGRATTRSQLQEDVQTIYATGYFSKVNVIPEDTPLGVRVTFEVVTNPVFKDVAIETVPATEKGRVLPQEAVNEIFKEQYGDILNLRDLQEGIKKVNEWYSKQGYDLAQVIGSPKIGEDGTVTLVISEGVIENIQVRYYTKEEEPVKGRTQAYIVTREMRLKPGDVFNRNTAQQDLQRIFGLGLFEDVSFNFEPGENPQEVIVNVNVIEGNTGSLAAGAGISSTSGLFGTVSYQQKNIAGRHQTLGGEFQLGERELLFDLSFSDPWIAGDPYRTSYTANLFRRRSISLVYDGEDSAIRTANGGDSPRIVRTGGGVTFLRPLAKDVFSRPNWVLSAGFLYQHVEVTNADGDIAPISQESQGSQDLAFSPSGIDDLFSFTFTASQDFRNNPLQPTSGYVARLGVEQTAPIGSGSIFFTRLRGSYSYYMPVKLLNFEFMKDGPQSLAFNVQAGTVLGDLPPYEAFVLGGSNSVRGYAEGEVGSGRSYFQATAEYRFPIVSVVGGALFLDYGTTIGSQGEVPGQPGNVRGLPGSGLGYGLGVRIKSPVGPIRVDYGFNDQGDSRLHFGIGERF